MGSACQSLPHRMHAAAVGVTFSLGDDALEIVLFYRRHERFPATIDRHGFGDQVIGAAPEKPIKASLAGHCTNDGRFSPRSHHGGFRREFRQPGISSYECCRKLCWIRAPPRAH